MYDYTKPFLFLFYLLFISTITFAQSQTMALRQSSAQGFTFINMEGEVLFSLPPGHHPTCREKREPFTLGNFYTIDFSKGFLPVTDGKNYYLINKKGEKIKDLGTDFKWVSKFQNGFFRGFKQVEGKANMIIYLDKDGNPALGKKQYWQASQFREGRAVVQLKDREGDWLLIDTTGKVKVNLSENQEGRIIMLHKFEYGFWHLGVNLTPKGFKHGNLFVRPDGRFTSKKSDFMPKPSRVSFPPIIHPDLLMNAALKNRFKEAPGFLPPPHFTTKTYGYFIFDDGKRIDNRRRRGVLYNQNYEIIALAPEGVNYKINPLAFYGQYLLTEKTMENGTVSTLFFDTENILVPQLEIKTPASGSKIKIVDNLLFVQKRGLFSDMITVEKIAYLSGEIIYEPNLMAKVFTSLTEALKTPEKVVELHLENINEKEVVHLKRFIHLEVLELRKMTIKNIPDNIFDAFPSLRSLTLSNCKHLVIQPKDIKKLSKLEKIVVYSCPELNNLATLLPNFTALRKCRTDNFSRKQLVLLRKKYPTIQFEVVPSVVRDK